MDSRRCLVQAERRDTAIEASAAIALNREIMDVARLLCPARQAVFRTAPIPAPAGRVFGPEQWRGARDQIDGVESLVPQGGDNPMAVRNSVQPLVDRTFLLREHR